MSDDRDTADQSRAARRYLWIALPLAAALFFAPIPARDLSAKVEAIETSRAPLAIVGPSTVDYVSPCDADRRDLATMLGDARHAAVLDLSEGGQSMNRSIGLAATVAARGAARDILLPLTWRGLDDLAVPTWREYVYFRALDPSVDLIRGADARALWSGINGRLGRQFEAFTFEGHAYPDYWKLMAGWFKRESAAKSCPERTAEDRRMTRAYYWWTHVATEPNPRLIDMMADLRDEVARRGRRLHLVLLPTNFELLGELDPSWPGPVRRRHADWLAAAAARGLDVLDLSDLLPSDRFSTRWCACAHLDGEGRADVAARIARFMDEPRMAAAVTAPARP